MQVHTNKDRTNLANKLSNFWGMKDGNDLKKIRRRKDSFAQQFHNQFHDLMQSNVSIYNLLSVGRIHNFMSFWGPRVHMSSSRLTGQSTSLKDTSLIVARALALCVCVTK
jgi:hypothetical protein